MPRLTRAVTWVAARSHRPARRQLSWPSYACPWPHARQRSTSSQPLRLPRCAGPRAQARRVRPGAPPVKPSPPHPAPVAARTQDPHRRCGSATAAIWVGSVPLARQQASVPTVDLGWPSPLPAYLLPRPRWMRRRLCPCGCKWPTRYIAATCGAWCTKVSQAASRPALRRCSVPLQPADPHATAHPTRFTPAAPRHRHQAAQLYSGQPRQGNTPHDWCAS
jgi:hypothetical protein